jgi:hypothetical protein
MTAVKRLKPVFKCTDEEKARFLSSTCLLTISVGQEVHEGEHFETTIELVNRSFGACILLIDDTLQRHTMTLASDNDAGYFYARSLEAGKQWLERNIWHYAQLSNLKQIIHWNHWLKHPQFEMKKAKIKALIGFDTDFGDAFSSTIDAFLHRYHRRVQDQPTFNIERARQLCLDYLVEECTAMCLWPEMDCHFEVYPSRRNRAMAETHRRFVLPNYPDLLHPVAIKFKHRKQWQPQQCAQQPSDTVVDEKDAYS